MSTELDKQLDEITKEIADSAWSLGLQGANYEELHSDRNNSAKAKQALTNIIEDREQKAHSKGMQFALACTDPWAGVEYPTQFTPIKSTAEKWLKDLEDAELKGERDV